MSIAGDRDVACFHAARWNCHPNTQTTIVVVLTSFVFAVYLAAADKVIQFVYELMFGAITS